MKKYETMDYEDYELSPLLPISNSKISISRPTWNIVNQIINYYLNLLSNILNFS